MLEFQSTSMQPKHSFFIDSTRINLNNVFRLLYRTENFNSLILWRPFINQKKLLKILSMLLIKEIVQSFLLELFGNYSALVQTISCYTTLETLLPDKDQAYFIHFF